MSIPFSIVAPIFNELESLPELYRRVRDVMSAMPETWELVLVDDGSSDGSTEAIRTLAHQAGLEIEPPPPRDTEHPA